MKRFARFSKRRQKGTIDNIPLTSVPKESKDAIAARLRSFRNSARLRLIGSAFLWTLGAALWLGAFARSVLLLGSVSSTLVFSISGALVLLVAIWRALVLWRKTPTLWDVARRVETTLPGDSGLLTAGLDFEFDAEALARSELRRSTVERAKIRLNAISSRAALAALNFPTWRRSRVLLTGALLITPTLLCFFAPSPIRQNESAESAPSASYFSPLSLLAPDEEEEIENERTVSFSAEDFESQLSAYQESLTRVGRLAASLAKELRGDSPDVSAFFSLDRETTAALDAPETGALALAESLSAFLSQTEPTDNSGRALASRLLARRLRETVARLCKERQERIVRARLVGESVRSENETARRSALEKAKDSLDLLAADVMREKEIVAVLAKSWDFGRELDAYHSEWKEVCETSIALMKERVGVFLNAPEIDRAPTDAFVARIARLKELQGDLRASLERFADALAEPKTLALLPLIVGDDALVGGLAREDWASVFNEADERLTGIATNARAERWGRAATELSAGGGFYSPATTSGSGETRERLALLLTLGRLGDKKTDVDLLENKDALAQTELARQEKGARTGTKESVKKADAEDVDPLARVGSPEAKDVSLGAKSNETETTNRTLDERPSESGRLSEQGANPDATFAGRSGSSGGGSATPLEDSDAYWDELPQDVRERLEAAQKWNPPEEELERSRAFRRRLWEEMLKR